MLSSQYNPLFWAVENIVSDSNKEVLFSHYYIDMLLFWIRYKPNYNLCSYNQTLLDA